MNMVCKCGGKEFFTEEHGNQTGLYCSACVVGALWGVSRGFCAWVYVYIGLPFPGFVAAFSGLVGTPPRGIDKGRNRAREYAEYSQKIKRPYKR